MTTLTPDLWAAYDAARKVQDDAQFRAAFFLTRPAPSLRLATEYAQVAQAARYEASQLAREAREAWEAALS